MMRFAFIRYFDRPLETLIQKRLRQSNSQSKSICQFSQISRMKNSSHHCESSNSSHRTKAAIILNWWVDYQFS